MRPDQISDAIGIEGDEIWSAGDKRPKTELVEIENGLIAKSKLDKCLDLETHIESMMKNFSSLEEKFTNFSVMPDCEIQLSCVIYSNGAPPLNFERHITRWIGIIGASLDIDVYIV
jgi:hypothetical protein